MTAFWPLRDVEAAERARVWRAAKFRALRSPPEFRALLTLEDQGEHSRLRRWQPWQLADFRALDAAWSRLAFGAGEPAARVRRGWIERPRGHSKTTDIAIQLCWILLAARGPLNGLVAAADLEQGQLVHRAMRRLQASNADLLKGLVFVENAVRNRSTGSLLKVVSSDVRSSWGELPDFVICDELCHWRGPELWQSLVSSAAKKSASILMVLTNAGTGRGWQWQARELARTDPAWHFSSLQGPQAPWITAESLEEQRRLLPPNVFARLWMNEWQHSDGTFVSLGEVAACRDPRLAAREKGEPGQLYVATVDYAEKRDFTVGCVAHREGRTVVVDRMDVVRPTEHRPTPVRWVHDWMRSIAGRFPSAQFVLDPYQLASVIQELSQEFPVDRYQFQGGQANCDMARLLRQLILEQRVRWPSGCGVVPGEERREPADDLEGELASLIVREGGGGRFRFDHVQDGLHHDDRSFALGAACQWLLRGPDVDPALLEISPPVNGGFGAW